MINLTINVVISVLSANKKLIRNFVHTGTAMNVSNVRNLHFKEQRFAQIAMLLIKLNSNCSKSRIITTSF